MIVHPCVSCGCLYYYRLMYISFCILTVLLHIYIITQY